MAQPECDVPVPGILVPGNCSLFLMVSELVLEKFGTKKSLGIGIKKFGTEKSLGIGIEKIWYRKKVSESVSEKFGTGKSLGTGIGNFLYQN